MVLLPGAAYLDAGLAVAAQTTGRPAPALDEVRFITPLVVEHNDVPTLRLTMEPSSGRFTVSSRGSSATSWTRHASGRIVDGLVRPTLALPVSPMPPPRPTRYTLAGRARPGVRPAFRRIVEAQVSDGRCWLASMPPPASPGRTTRPHPAALDAALQRVALLAEADEASVGGAVAPAAVRHVRQFAAFPIRSWSASPALPQSRARRSWSPMSCSPTQLARRW